MNTPGPWAIRPADRAIVTEADPSRLIAHGGSLLPADAALVAAAQDLLAALEAVLPHIPGHLTNNLHGRPWIEQARAAIARAKGGI